MYKELRCHVTSSDSSKQWDHDVIVIYLYTYILNLSWILCIGTVIAWYNQYCTVYINLGNNFDCADY